MSKSMDDRVIFQQLKNPWWHAVFWCCWAVLEIGFLLHIDVPGKLDQEKTILFYYTYTIVLFYLNNRFLFRRFTNKRHLGRWLLLSGLAEVLLVFGLLVAVSVMAGSAQVQFSFQGNWVFELANWMGFVSPFIYYLPLSLLYTMLQKFLQERMYRRGQEIALSQLEREAQVIKADTHLVFTLFSLLRSHTANHTARRTIDQASDLFRNQLLRGKNERITLGDEYAQCERLIALQGKQRSSCELPNLICPQELLSIEIIPMVLLTPLENIFRHGNLLFPSYLKVSLRHGGLHIVAVNRKQPNPTAGTGSGLSNLEKQLQRKYPGKCKFWYCSAADSFWFYLRLDLHQNLCLNR